MFSCSSCSSCSGRPSFIEYLSYNLNFMSVLVGPCSNYKDYIDFIEGRHISRRLRQHSSTCNGHNGYDKTPDLSPRVCSLMRNSVAIYLKTGLWTSLKQGVFTAVIIPFTRIASGFTSVKASTVCVQSLSWSLVKLSCVLLGSSSDPYNLCFHHCRTPSVENCWSAVAVWSSSSLWLAPCQ